MTPSDWLLLHHFRPAEFERPEKMGFQFMVKLDLMRDHAGVPFKITSSYRTPAHNKAVGGARNSAHTDDLCQAVDIWPATNADRYHILHAAFVCGFNRIGLYQNGSIHLDTTDDQRPAPRLWCVVENPA